MSNHDDPRVVLLTKYQHRANGVAKALSGATGRTFVVEQNTAKTHFVVRRHARLGFAADRDLALALAALHKEQEKAAAAAQAQGATCVTRSPSTKTTK